MKIVSYYVHRFQKRYFQKNAFEVLERIGTFNAAAWKVLSLLNSIIIFYIP